jgi:hypothetical protein
VSDPPRQARPPRARRHWRRVLVLLWATPLALALLSLLLWLAVPPERIVPMVLARVGASLGLEISAQGDAATRLGRRPSVVVRDLLVREPGADRPLLRARRALVAVPWRTIRGLGDPLELATIELDAAELDVAALRLWLSSRPAGSGRLPRITDGLRVRDGRIDGGRWRIELQELSVPQLREDAPLRARARGRYVDPATRVPFDLAATLQRPASGRGFAVVGTLAPESEGWQLSTWATLSGALHWQESIALLPARLGLHGHAVSGQSPIPFSLGLHGPLRAHAGAWTLLPAGIALRGDGPVPHVDARGRLALGGRLLLDLDGSIARWPSGWPALPPPLGASDQPLALSARYLGAAGFTDPLALSVAREDLRFEGRLDVPGLVRWIGGFGRGSLLPPLSGRLEAAAMEISGARLEGVSIQFEDDGNPAP